MTERYPDDATLLALSEDEATGVEYIPTGRTPYYLEFRRMLHRLLRAAERANDLRVYQDGDLTIGVRPGRALIDGTVIAFAGTSGVAVASETTVHVWLDDVGEVQTGDEGLPAHRATFVPLAKIVTGPAAIESVTDLRGEALLATPSLTAAGVTATVEELNQALAGIGEGVTASALTTLTGGLLSTADLWHTHLGSQHDEDGEGRFMILNNSGSSNANAALQFGLPNAQPADTFLLVNRDTGYLKQRFNNVAYNLLGTVQPQYLHAGELTQTLDDLLLGAVPVAGTVTDVILSVRENIESSEDADGVRATVRVNGDVLTDTDPELTAADGTGFRSTDQNDGTAAAIVSTGVEQVQRGDILTLDLTRTATGSVSNEARDIAVLVVIRVEGPE